MHGLWLLVLLKLLVPSPVFVHLPWATEAASPAASSAELGFPATLATVPAPLIIQVPEHDVADELPRPDDVAEETFRSSEPMPPSSPAIAAPRFSWSWKPIVALLWVSGAS